MKHSPSHAEAQWCLECFSRIPLRGQRRTDHRAMTNRLPVSPHARRQGAPETGAQMTIKMPLRQPPCTAQRRCYATATARLAVCTRVTTRLAGGTCAHEFHCLGGHARQHALFWRAGGAGDGGLSGDLARGRVDRALGLASAGRRRGIGSLYCLFYALNHQMLPSVAASSTNLTLSVVALSIVVHGLSVQPLLARYETGRKRRGQ